MEAEERTRGYERATGGTSVLTAVLRILTASMSASWLRYSIYFQDVAIGWNWQMAHEISPYHFLQKHVNLRLFQINCSKIK